MFDIPVPSKTDVNIPVPQKAEISVETYNAALKKLQQSLKESAELIDCLSDMRTQIMEEEAQEIDNNQEHYTEQLMFESYCDGPMFEKVEEANKEEIRSIAKKIRTQMLSMKRLVKNNLFKLKGSNITNMTYMADVLGSSATGTSAISALKSLIIWGSNMWIIDPAIISSFNNSELKLKSWQTICFFLPIGGKNIGAMKTTLNTEFKDILGDKYEIGVVKVKFVAGTFRGKKEADDNESPAMNDLNNYLLVVNQKGTALSNKEIVAEATNDRVKGMVRACAKFLKKKVDTSSESGMIASIKQKFQSKMGKKASAPEEKKNESKKDEKKAKVENKNESYELDLGF